MKNNTIVIGLTGPTGCGKSTVADTWKKLGAVIIDADQLARDVVETGSPCLKELSQYFSEKILNKDGSLNRKELAKRAFSSSKETQILTSITHPYILDRCYKMVAQFKKDCIPYVVIDAPLLFESKLNDCCDFCVCVVSDLTTRKNRIMVRDQISDQDALQRISQQHDDSFYTKQSQFVIENNETLEKLILKAKEFWKCQLQVVVQEVLQK